MTNGETSLATIIHVIKKSLTIIPSVLSQLSNFLRHSAVPQVHVGGIAMSFQPCLCWCLWKASSQFSRPRPCMLERCFFWESLWCHYHLRMEYQRWQKSCAFTMCWFLKVYRAGLLYSIFRKTFVVLSTYPGIIRQQICLAMSFIVSQWRWNTDTCWAENSNKRGGKSPKCSLKTRKSDMQSVCWYNYEPSSSEL